MSTYISKVVFKVHGGSNVHFDEQWRLVHGSSTLEVLNKSTKIGLSEEEIIIRQDGSQSRWEFVGVIEIVEIDKNQDGAFIFSHTEEPDHIDQYMHTIRQRAEQIETITLAN